MSNLTIKIRKGFSDGSLRLSDHGHTNARRRDFVIWKINENIEVTSIEEISIKPNSTNIFKTPPHPHGDDWIAEIKPDVPDYSECNYSISWNGIYGHKVYDPKISIKPSTINFTKLVIGISLGVFALLSLEFFRRKRRQW